MRLLEVVFFLLARLRKSLARRDRLPRGNVTRGGT